MSGVRRRPRASNREVRLANSRAAYAMRMEFLRRFKRLRGCTDCGCHDWRCLTIDHMDGKTMPISQCSSIAAIKAEIRRHRCEVRCANCHMIRTYEEQSGRPARELAKEAAP